MKKAYLPPFDLELEQAVLGAVMLEKVAAQVVLNIVKDEEFFYKEHHRVIFRAVKKLFLAGTAIDMLTVTSALRELGTLDAAGGPYEIANLTTKVNSSANLEYHIHYLLQLYTRRKLQTMAADIHRKASDEMYDPFDLINEISKGLSGTMDTLITKKPVMLSQAYAQAIEKIQAGIGKSGLVGVPSGIASIDKLTGGWQNSDLIIIAARPAMGKTAVALQYAKNAALKHGKKTVLFSLEMSTLQLLYRLISSESNVTNSELSKALLSMDELQQVALMSKVLQSNNLILDDTPGLTVMELRTKCTKLKADFDIEMIIVDYLQLMRGERGGNREQEISSISRGLKLVAKELNVPVIALSQLSRAVETRGGDKRPMLSDLRESGSIEQDADTVIFLYRPEYYGIKEDEMGNPTEGTLEHIFAKHRNGPLDRVLTKCELAHCKITDYTDIYHIKQESVPHVSFNPLPKSDFDEPPPF